MSIRSEEQKFWLADELATFDLGGKIARAISAPPLVIYLIGDLGAGKTTLVRGMLRSLGYPGKVVSPTYTLLEPYEVGDIPFLHVDLYRIADAEELEFLGLRDRLADAVLLVEWPVKGRGFLPEADILVSLDVSGQGRQASVCAGTSRGAAVIDRIVDFEKQHCE